MNYFQELAAKYDAWFNTPHGQYVYRYEFEAVMGLADIRPGISVADIGCGTGIYTNVLCNVGAQVVGVDISPEMLEIAAEKNKQHGDKLRFVAADAAQLPFADESFDMVISITAMEFFEQPRKCLQEMCRIVRPGGRVIVATLNSLSLWSLERRIKTAFSRTIFRHAHFYSLGEMKDLLKPYPISDWRGCVFVPPFAPQYLIEHPDAVERWGQKYLPAFGTFLAVRVDKN